MFVAGAVALDFLNSIATPLDEAVDWIGNGEGYLVWLKAAGLISAADLQAIQKSMSVKQLDSAAAKARGLRDWFREFVLEHQGRKLPAAALAKLQRLNDLLREDEIFWKIEAAKVGPRTDRMRVFEVAPQRRWTSAQALLLPVAEAMAKLVCSADFRDVKPCEGKNCTLLFLDETRRRARRWCSMAVCGNRAKQAEHRKRAKNN